LSSIAPSDAPAAASCSVELLSPIAPSDAQAAASSSVELLSPIAPSDAQAAAASSVELLSPIAPSDAQAAAAYGFRGCWFYRSRGLIAPIDWGQSIYHSSTGVSQCRAIVLNSSTRRASGGVLRFSRLLVLPVARTYRSDRLGTIDLPCRRRLPV
jgi:hypothetical protein